MIKIYIPNISNTSIGGGFSFLRNFKKALQDKVQFVNTWQESDIVFVFGITTIDKAEIHNVIASDKRLVLRVDNIPRKSRNRRQSPSERLTEFGNKASMVVYQSEWCKKYAGYFIDNKNEVIINNGVDTDIFNQDDRNSEGKTYLYINYNDNPNKRFDEAMYWFEMEWRKDNDARLVIAGTAPKIYLENPEYNWDLNVPAKVEYTGIMDTPKSVAEVMKYSDYLLYPSFAEAYPNTILEAMACGVKPLYLNNEGGAMEAYLNSIAGYKEGTFKYEAKITEQGIKTKIDYKVKTIQEMGNEYLQVFNKLINKV